MAIWKLIDIDPKSIYQVILAVCRRHFIPMKEGTSKALDIKHYLGNTDKLFSVTENDRKWKETHKTNYELESWE